MHYHLRVQELVLAAGEEKLLTFAVNDVEETMQAATEMEAVRVEATEEIGLAMGLGPTPTLEVLVAETEEPFSSMFAEHRTAFMELVSSITTVSLNGREHLQRGLALTLKLTSTVLGDRGDRSDRSDGGYDSTGAVVRGSAQRRLVDRSM